MRKLIWKICEILLIMLVTMQVDFFWLLCFWISLTIQRESIAGLNKRASPCSEPSLVKTVQSLQTHKWGRHRNNNNNLNNIRLLSVLGMRVERPCSVAFIFKYFRQFRKKRRPSTFITLLRGSTIALITSIHQARTCGRVGAPGPTPVLKNSERRMFMFRVKTLSALDRHWRNPRRKIISVLIIPVHVLIYSNPSRRPFLGQVAFHLRPIGLQTLVAIDSESYQTSFPSFCAPPCEVALLFNLNLSRRPFLGQVVHFRSAALHRIRFGTWGFVRMS